MHNFFGLSVLLLVALVMGTGGIIASYFEGKERKRKLGTTIKMQLNAEQFAKVKAYIQQLQAEVAAVEAARAKEAE